MANHTAVVGWVLFAAGALPTWYGVIACVLAWCSCIDQFMKQSMRSMVVVCVCGGEGGGAQSIQLHIITVSQDPWLLLINYSHHVLHVGIQSSGRDHCQQHRQGRNAALCRSPARMLDLTCILPAVSDVRESCGASKSAAPQHSSCPPHLHYCLLPEVFMRARLCVRPQVCSCCLGCCDCFAVCSEMAQSGVWWSSSADVSSCAGLRCCVSQRDGIDCNCAGDSSLVTQSLYKLTDTERLTCPLLSIWWMSFRACMLTSRLEHAGASHLLLCLMRSMCLSGSWVAVCEKSATTTHWWSF
jgi:hypothetical protein